MRAYLFILLAILCRTVVKGDFIVESPSINPVSFTAYGNGASVNNSVIRLSLGASGTGGRVIYNTAQDISNGFVTEIEWQSFDCDTYQWQGADGFTFFMGPNVGASVNDLTYGSDLAISSLSSAVAIAFYISGDPNPIEPTHVVFCGVGAMSNLTTPIASPHCTAINAPALIPIRCTNDTHRFQIRYTPPNTWQVMLDNKEIAEYTSLLVSDYFKETSVQVGLSGGTGSGFMRQDVTYWSLEGALGVIPYLECLQDFENGTFRAHLGYKNLGSAPVTYAVGSTNNNVTQSYASFFPSIFAPGRTLTYPLAAISFDWDGSEISWQLTDYLLTFSGNMTDRLCPKDIKMDFQFTSPTVVPDAEVTVIVHHFANFSDISPIRVICIMISYGNPVKRQTSGVEAELQVLILAANDTFVDEPSAEQIVSEFVSSANANTSIADPILNPNSTEGRQLIGTKPLNGNELPGTALSQQVRPPVSSPTTNNGPISNQPSVPVPGKTPSSKIMSNGSRTIFSVVLATCMLIIL